MQTVRIVRGPHELWVGANGRRTFGVTVETVKDLPCVGSHPREYPYQRRWDINDFSIAQWDANSVAGQLGMTPDEVRELQARVALLVGAQ